MVKLTVKSEGSSGSVVDEEGPNDDMEPVKVHSGYGPHIAKFPMHKNADIDHGQHAKREQHKAHKETSVKKTKPSVTRVEKSTDGLNKSFLFEEVACLDKFYNIEKAAKSGPGSRGGKIVRHTKSGAPVYESQAKKQAEQSSTMMHNWHNIADRTGKGPGFHGGAGAAENPEHHAIAAKQALHAAYFHHHAGDEISSHDAMGYANHHRAAYEKAGHTSRTTNAVAKLHGSTAHEVGHAGWEPSEHGLSDDHSVANDADLGGDHKKAAKVRASSPEHSKSKVTKSLGNSIGGNNMSKNEVADLFKSELGDEPLTTCVHCDHSLTKSDMMKGMGASFVADDNDNPHDGPVPGQVEPSRPDPKISENDVIAPLLKSCKGSVHGDLEEFPISKSEMSEMGMNTDGMDEGWYKISKSELTKQGCSAYVEYLADRKTTVAKSLKPSVQLHTEEEVKLEKSVPRGYSPRAGGTTGNGGEQLIQWSQGSDAEVAKFIEQNGGYGQGNDELVKTGQRH